MSKILVIEDEENIRELIKFNLESEGNEVLSCGNGKEGLEMAMSRSPDLILLDIMLPVMDGYDVIKTLRREGNETPVIMLTAKNDEVDKIIGLEFGADDYITKPFSTRELKARIKAVLRRYYAASEKAGKAVGNEAAAYNGAAANNEASAGGNGSTGAAAADKDRIKINGIIIDVPAREVIVSGNLITLSMKEFDLLKILAENRNHVLTREQLLDSVWGYEYYGETRTVDVHIRYLRKKLGGKENKYIVTVRGVGYKMI